MITAIDKNTALVLIDLQKGIVQLPLAHPADDILQQVNKLIAGFRDAGKSIIFINVIPQGAWLKSRKDAEPPRAAPPSSRLGRNKPEAR